MIGLRLHPGWLGVLAGLLGVSPAPAQPAPKPPPAPLARPEALAAAVRSAAEAAPEAMAAKLKGVADRPSLQVRGPAEAFRCDPALYFWLLDHPDRAVRGWQRMGAKVSNIVARGPGRFGCKDDQGTDVTWHVVLSEKGLRVWYAEGVVKPGLLLPQVTVRAVIVVYIREGKDAADRTAVRHQGELLLQMDGRAARVVTRIFGASMPKMAEQYVGQIQTFFAGLAWYCNENPEKIPTLLKP